MRIQHNIMSMNAFRYYNGNNKALSSNLEKLSSGYKINRAADDAAGLAISEKMRAEITGLKTAQSNAQSGINLVQTAEGALTEVHDMLNRMVELADQSANGTYDDGTDRANLQKEFEQLSSEIDRIADASNFNGQALFDGSLSDRTAVSTASAGKIDFTFESTYVPAVGDTVTVNGKTYKFVANGVTEGGTGSANDPFTVALSATPSFATDMGSLATKIGNKDTSVTASATGSTLTVTSNTAGSANDISSIASASKATKVFHTAAKDATEKSEKLTLQIGGTADSYNKITLSIANMHIDHLGKNVETGADGYVTSGKTLDTLKIDTQAAAADAVDIVKAAINQVSETRGDLGATQNRLEHTINNLSVMTENIQDAESSIRDVDVAAEMMEYTKNNILVQSAQSMLAQANQAPQGVLQLLQ